MDSYLLDANVFITAKNQHYRFDFCTGFWSWIEDCHAKDLVYSVSKVKKELQNADKFDLARKWAEQMPSSFFLPDESEAHVMANYAKLMNWANENAQYMQKAKDEFALGTNADAFLIARAITDGRVIVSHETQKQPDVKARIPIPNAANAFGVKVISIFDLLSGHANPTFQLHMPNKITLMPTKGAVPQVSMNDAGGASELPTSSV
jgi:hypothetical protein